MTLPEYILFRIKSNHIGRESAIHRRPLLEHLFNLGWIDRISKATDRKTRGIIEDNPEICSCEDGYFYDGGVEDVVYSVEYIRKKAIPLLVKINNRKAAYPQYYPDFDPSQRRFDFDE